MKKLMFKHFALMLAILNTSPTFANWIQSTGTGWVNQNNVQLARQKAIEDALHSALLRSGASVSSQQTVSNGLLTQDSFQVRSAAIVNQVQILSEKQQGQRYIVELRAEVFPDDRQCMATGYSKSVSFLPPAILHPVHAQIGGLHQLGNSLAGLLSRQAQQNSRHLKVKTGLANPVQLATGSAQAPQNIQIIQTLGAQNNSQFVVLGQLSDLSMGQQPGQFARWFEDAKPTRYFQLDLQVYDTLSGNMVHQLSIQDQAAWTFDQRQRVDPYSRTFWQSEFGQMIQHRISRAVEEISNTLACEAGYGQVIRQQNNQLIIDMGRSNGVRTRDKFRLFHHQTFNDRQGRNHQQLIRSELVLTVVQLSEYTSIVEGEKQDLLLHIQAGDRLLPAQ